MNDSYNNAVSNRIALNWKRCVWVMNRSWPTCRERFQEYPQSLPKKNCRPTFEPGGLRITNQQCRPPTAGFGDFLLPPEADNSVHHHLTAYGTLANCSRLTSNRRFYSLCLITNHAKNNCEAKLITLYLHNTSLVSFTSRPLYLRVKWNSFFTGQSGRFASRR